MGQLTESLPKPLLPVAGKALIVHQIEQLRDAGFSELVINLAYRGAQIRAHLGSGQNFGVSIEYSEEPTGALDTGGGIAKALDLLGPEPFTVVNCDVWSDFDFSTLRIAGVLQRIAVVYGITAIVVLNSGLVGQAMIAVALLVIYWLLMTFVPVPGHGPGLLEPATNLSAHIDCSPFGRSRRLRLYPDRAQMCQGGHAGHRRSDP